MSAFTCFLHVHLHIHDTLLAIRRVPVRDSELRASAILANLSVRLDSMEVHCASRSFQVLPELPSQQEIGSPNRGARTLVGFLLLSLDMSPIFGSPAIGRHLTVPANKWASIPRTARAATISCRPGTRLLGE